MLIPVAGNTLTSTDLPLAVGAVIGAVGSLVFIMRSHAFDEEEREGHAQARQSAVRRVLVIYATAAWICFATAVVLGDVAFIVTTGVLALLAGVGLARLWSAMESPPRPDRGDAASLVEYRHFKRNRPVRLACLAVAFIAFGLSLVADDPFFIAGSAFVLATAVLSALVATRKERRLASLSEEAGKSSMHLL